MAFVPKETIVGGVSGIAIAAGGFGGGYLRKFLKKQAFYVQYIESNFKEWSSVIMAVAVAVVYELARKYLGALPEYMDKIIAGVVAGFAAEAGRVFAGDTEIFVTGKQKILAKNVGTISKVIIDGQDVTQNVNISGEEVDLSNANVSAGVHKVIVLGNEKAAYEEIYIPA